MVLAIYLYSLYDISKGSQGALCGFIYGYARVSDCVSEVNFWLTGCTVVVVYFFGGFVRAGLSYIVMFLSIVSDINYIVLLV